MLEEEADKAPLRCCRLGCRSTAAIRSEVLPSVQATAALMDGTVERAAAGSGSRTGAPALVLVWLAGHSADRRTPADSSSNAGWPGRFT